MLQTFLLIDEFASLRGSKGAAGMAGGANAAGAGAGPGGSFVPVPHTAENEPASKLRDLGLRVIAASLAEPRALLQQLETVDAVLLSVPLEAIGAWRSKVLAARSVPILLWCDDLTFPQRECKLDVEIDGLLSVGMSARDLHASLLLSFHHYMARRQWAQEREQLLSRLEERKWIDQAKGILSEIKGISEAEAYDFLRKQAMNERKRMIDVATSIVKVYQLLQDQNKGGRRK
jgi:response regulator NasT